MSPAVQTALLAQSSAAMILLAAGMLIYRSFREKFLLVWLLGWTFYLAQKITATAVLSMGTALEWRAISEASFVIAVFLFVSSALLYTKRRSMLLPAAILGALALEAALVDALVFPHARWPGVVLWFLYHALTVLAAVCLLLFSRGRPKVGLGLLTLMFLFLHFDLRPASPHVLAGWDLVSELLFGISMMIVVLDESKQRALQLAIMNDIGSAVAEAGQPAPLMQQVLEKITRLSGARAAWFRLLEGDRLVLGESLGLSEHYRAERKDLPLDESLSVRVIRQGTPGIVRTAAESAETRLRLRTEGFHHVLVIPLGGKAAVIGTMNLAYTMDRIHTRDEMHLLANIANQVGLALENLRMLLQVMRSQGEWVGTFDSIPDCILVHGPNFRIIKMNRALLQKLGREPQALIGRTCEEVLPKLSPWQDCPYCSQSAHGEVPDPCFGGFSLISTSHLEQTGTREGTIHVIVDTTERRRAEENFRRLFEQMREGVFVSTPDGRLLECNDAFARILGFETARELREWGDASQFYAQPEGRARFQQEMAEHGYVRNYEVELRRRDGSRVTGLENSFATRGPDGTILQYQGFLLDITEKKRAEEELKGRNRELSLLNRIATASNQAATLDEVLQIALQQLTEVLQLDTGGIYLIEPGKHCLKRRASFGHRSEMAMQMEAIELGDGAWERIHRERPELTDVSQPAARPGIAGAYSAAEGLQASLWCFLWKREDLMGVLGISSRSARVFTDSEKALVAAVARQLANTVEKVQLYEEARRAYQELSRAQEQLLQSEKMSSMGQLIAGVAHELNNPLTAILGYAQLLEEDQLEPQVAEYIQKIHRQAQRTHRIVQNLLSFARQRPPKKEIVDVRAVLEETLALRDYDFKLHNINLERHFEDSLPKAVADPHKLEQVFLNIVNNAVDAILESARDGLIRVRLYAQDGYVCAEFQDSGAGIREPHRIFDPFYTTKGIGKGTGLGLSICYGIISAHGGEIRAHNAAEGGAVFEVRLPAGAHDGESLEGGDAGSAAALHGRVLVVDDEQPLLELATKALAAAGAEVTTASSGRGAFELVRDCDFEAIVLDHEMAGEWSTEQIYAWCREHRPHLVRRIIVTVTNLNDRATRSFIDRTGMACIVKPFQIDDLIGIIRSVMQKSRVTMA